MEGSKLMRVGRWLTRRARLTRASSEPRGPPLDAKRQAEEAVVGPTFQSVKRFTFAAPRKTHRISRLLDLLGFWSNPAQLAQPARIYIVFGPKTNPIQTNTYL